MTRWRARISPAAETDCEITRKTLPTFGPALHPAASNVVKLKKRQ
jgi:hypothetical protein